VQHLVLLNMVMKVCAKGWQAARIFDHVPTLHDTFIFCLFEVQLLIKQFGVYYIIHSCS